MPFIIFNRTTLMKALLFEESMNDDLSVSQAAQSEDLKVMDLRGSQTDQSTY